MIDAPGPWGTGPFTLAEGYSSISTRCAIMRADPFACTWLIESEDRTPRLVLEVNRNHWNPQRVPRLERVVFRNDLSPTDALERCIAGEGEVDIVTEVSPADAERVKASPYATLQAYDANRVLVGIVNRYASDVPLRDVRARQALNLAVDVSKVIAEGLAGYATPLAALTPPWCSGFPGGQQPYPYDAGQARSLMRAAGWPQGRPLRLATPGALAGIASLVAADLEAALGLGVDITVIPAQQGLAALRMLVEKKIVPAWDVLLHGWFDLSSEAPPAAVHREFFGSDGAFRAGPELPEFDRLYAEMAAQIDGAKLVAVAERIDKLVYDEALALFLCAPQALYAVNKHVSFLGYRTTFELAETAVDEEHWSRHSAANGSPDQAAAPQGSTGIEATGFHGAGC